MRRLLALVALAVALVLGAGRTAGALSPIEPTTTTGPVVITEPEGLDDDPPTTAPPTTWPPIGGPGGDVVDPSLADRLLPEAAVAGGVVIVVGVGAVLVAVRARRRRPVPA